MVRKLSDEKIELIQDLYYNKGLGPKEIVRRVGVSNGSVYFYTRGIERGFKSSGEYCEYTARNKRFKSLYSRQKHMARNMGFMSYSDYLKYSAKSRGFKSYSEYLEYLDKQRQQRPENRKLSRIIKRTLHKLDRDQNWLARQTGISQSGISKYVNGIRIPEKNLQQRILKALHLPRKTLDDLLK